MEQGGGSYSPESVSGGTVAKELIANQREKSGGNCGVVKKDVLGGGSVWVFRKGAEKRKKKKNETVLVSRGWGGGPLEGKNHPTTDRKRQTCKEGRSGRRKFPRGGGGKIRGGEAGGKNVFGGGWGGWWFMFSYRREGMR